MSKWQLYSNTSSLNRYNSFVCVVCTSIHSQTSDTQVSIKQHAYNWWCWYIVYHMLVMWTAHATNNVCLLYICHVRYCVCSHTTKSIHVLSIGLVYVCHVCQCAFMCSICRILPICLFVCLNRWAVKECMWLPKLKKHF